MTNRKVFLLAVGFFLPRVRVELVLLLTETLQTTTGRLAWELLCVVVVIYGIALEFRAVSFFNARTVYRRKHNSHGGCLSLNPVNEYEGASEQKTNDNEGESLAHAIVRLGEVPILPDDVSGLRAYLKLEVLV